MSDDLVQPIRLATDALVVLAGPSGSGKSTWASEWFRPSHVVSTDRLRGVVGEHEHDLRASDDAFEVLDAIVERRMARGLCTVIDSLGMDAEKLTRWRAMAASHSRPAHLIAFDVEAATCRRRNKTRPDPVPARVLSAQLETWADVRSSVGDGFDHVHVPAPARLVPSALLDGHDGRSARTLRFGLLIATFDWPGGNEGIADRLGQIAAEAESAGFESIWVMDHFMQIPQVGRDWDAMLESYTTLGFLAARTSRVELGAMVSCITHRSLGHLGKIVATLDVLSGGRARCGLGLGWYEREHHAYGLGFPSIAERYELLSDALEFLPLLWGPGSPDFAGRRFSTPEAICYPRPLRSKVPILVGGSGEQRTLRLVAERADACNLFGEPDVVAHKVGVLERHCSDVGRSLEEIEVTQLSPVLVAGDHQALSTRVDELRSVRETPERFAERVAAGTAEEHIDRFGRLAEAGVQNAIVSLADVGHEGSVAGFADVITAFSNA